MRDEEFDKILKSKIQEEIKKPNSLEVDVMNTLNQKVTKQSKLKIKIIKIIQAITSLLAIGAVTGGVYAAITGTSVFEMLGLKEKGLKKASENYEQVAVEINKKIESDNAIVELRKIAYDDALLILEYNIQFTDEGFERIQRKEAGKDLDDNTVDINPEAEVTDEDVVGLTGEVTVNGTSTVEIAKYSEKVSEKEFKLFHIISLMDKEESNLKIMTGAHFVEYNNMTVSLGDVYCFLIDLDIVNKQQDTEREEIVVKDTTVSVGNIIDTKLASFAKVETEITNLKSSDFDDEDPTDISFYVLNENKEEIESVVYMVKDMIHTENDEIVDLLNDYRGSNILYDNRLNMFDSVDGRELEYKNGTLKQECLILFPNGVGDSKKVTIFATRDGKEIADGVEVKVNTRDSENVKINKVEVDRNYGDKFLEYMPTIEKESEENPYYTENAPKINLKEYDIYGLKLGMTRDEAIKVIEENCEKHGTELGEFREDGGYDDEFVSVWFNSNGKLAMISLNDMTHWEDSETTEKEFISRYYSEPKYEIVQDGIHTYKILYGKDVFEADLDRYGLKGDYAYIYVSDGKDSFIQYYSDNIVLSFVIDQTTKKIKSDVSLSYEMVEEE